MHDVREGEGEVLRKFVQNASRRRVPSGERGGEMPRFPTRLFTDQSCENAVRRLGLQSPDARVDGPARAARLDDRAVAIEAHVAELRFARRRAVIDRAIDDESTADAATEGDVEEGVE